MRAPLAAPAAPNVTCRVTVDDPAFVVADALARPVNEQLQATTALGRRVELAAGPGLQQQLRLSDPLDVGAAVVTAAGAVEAKLMIHAVVMTREERVTRTGVQRCMTAVLQRASDWGIAHVAVMPFGLGAGNLDIDESARAMLDAVDSWRGRARAPLTLTFVVETPEEADAFRLPGGVA